MNTAKRHIFASMFDEIVDILRTMDPEKAKGIEQLKQVHDTLFGSSEDEEDSIDNRSNTLDSLYWTLFSKNATW